MKRVKIVRNKTPNPLFEKWLTEWKNEAAGHGSEAQHTYGRALKSLKKYPFKLKSGKECIILENFGKKICDMLDKKLLEYKGGLTADEWNELISDEMTAESSESIDSGFIDTGPEQPTKRSSPNDSYMPRYKSGGHAILIALVSEGGTEGMKKTQIMETAQQYCDTSFTKPAPGSKYTAWSSMATLMKKQLVFKEGRPLRFKLTEQGRKLASKLTTLTKNDFDVFSAETPPLSPRINQTTKNKPDDVDSASLGLSSSGTCSESKEIISIDSQSSNKEKENHQTVFLFPSQFRIILLVDIHETEIQGGKKVDKTLQMLEASGIQVESRHLTVGDFLWVARDASKFELTLPYIVERKRMDDLASSIKDGRFHEQKFRLKSCGVPNVIYLVEKFGHNPTRLGLPLSTLLQACSNTQIVDRFHVEMTQSLEQSVRYLVVLTKQIIKMFKDKTLLSCPKNFLPERTIDQDLVSLMPFEEFNKDSVKNKKWTVKDIFVKQLLQLKGLSVDKAIAIAEKFGTPSAMIPALFADGEKAIADIPYSGKRKIGPAIAKVLHQLYTSCDIPV